MPPELQSLNSTERFTDRVDNYVKYRPHYPQAVFDMLRDELRFGPGTAVADIGSGTGISTKPLLELGCTVVAVEPNDAMRNAAKQWLGDHSRLTYVAGTAEKTTLGDRSVDAVLSAQAFHWFNAEKARNEFARIMKADGWVVLLWNDRIQAGPFYEAYERLIRRYATDYDQVRARGKAAVESDLRSFFDGRFQSRKFKNDLHLDFARLKGLLLSASYTPRESQPEGARMIAELHEIYDQLATDGTVRMLCETSVYVGQLASGAKAVTARCESGA